MGEMAKNRPKSLIFTDFVSNENLNYFLCSCTKPIFGKYVVPDYECYKKLASRLWPVLFTLTDFLLLHTLFCSVAKYKVNAIAIFLSKLEHRPLSSYIY